MAGGSKGHGRDHIRTQVGVGDTYSSTFVVSSDGKKGVWVAIDKALQNREGLVTFHHLVNHVIG